MLWCDACTPYFEGRVVGNSPLGGCRGDGEDARGVTAIRQVAGANPCSQSVVENERVAWWDKGRYGWIPMRDIEPINQ